jgi:hypothetical protein
LLRQSNYCIEPFIGITQFKLGRVIKKNNQSWLCPSVGTGTSAFFLYPYGQINEKQSFLQKFTLVTPSIDVGINEDIFLTRVNPGEKSMEACYLPNSTLQFFFFQ